MLNLEEHHPQTMEEAINFLEKALSDPERDEILREGAEMYHFGLGMRIRNAWLHPRRNQLVTPLSKYFIDRFGWLHADDMSTLILKGLTAAVRGKEYDPHPYVAKCKKHWAENGVNPETGEDF